MMVLDDVHALADLVRTQARRHADAAALTFEGRTRTFAELDARASRIANALLSEGLQPGARIAWLAIRGSGVRVPLAAPILSTTYHVFWPAHPLAGLA